MAQISYSLNGDFCPTITPLFQGVCCAWSVVFSMMDSLLIEGGRLWVYRGELQAVFATELWTLAACCFMPVADGDENEQRPFAFGTTQPALAIPVTNISIPFTTAVIRQTCG